MLNLADIKHALSHLLQTTFFSTLLQVVSNYNLEQKASSRKLRTCGWGYGSAQKNSFFGNSNSFSFKLKAESVPPEQKEKECVHRHFLLLSRQNKSEEEQQLQTPCCCSSNLEVVVRSFALCPTTSDRSDAGYVHNKLLWERIRVREQGM
jgi:hypothetical protein